MNESAVMKRAVDVALRSAALLAAEAAAAVEAGDFGRAQRAACRAARQLEVAWRHLGWRPGPGDVQ